MTKYEYSLIYTHIDERLGIEEALDLMTDRTGQEMVRSGHFLAYYSDIWGEMKKWYGTRWDKNRYISPRATGPYWGTIDGVAYYLRMRGDEPYLWQVYVNKVASVLEKVKRNHEEREV